LKHLWQRRSLAWLGLLLAFALVVAACGDDTTASTTTEGSTTTTAATTTTQGTTTTTAPPGKPYGGEVIIGADQEPPTLNTYLPGGNNFIVSIVGQTYWMGVQDIDGYTLELVPDVVTELPSVDNGGIAVNADGTETIKYSIRDEAVWADGTPISGDDFAFTYDTIMNPDYPITTTIYEDILPDSVVAGPKTFEFTLSAPTVQAEFLFGVLLPKHDVEGKDFLNDYNDSMWMSGGPFEFEQWNKGDFLSVTRNPNFWKTDAETGQQLPFLDRVIFRFIPETASLINAFKAREVDAINPPPSIATIEDLQTLEPEGATIEVLSGPIWEHMWFTMGTNNRNAGSYNSHLNFRKAVAHALNKQQIVDDILAGQVEPMDSYVDAFAPTLSQGSWAQYDYNPETAIQYIADLCAEDGVDCVANPPKAIFSTTSNNDARAKLAELFAEYLPAVGILYEAQLEDSSLFFGETLDFGTADLGEFAWVGTPGFAGLIGIHDVWDPEAPPPDGQNSYRWGTPEVTGADPAGFNQGASYVVDENTARFAELRDLMNSTVDQALLEEYLHEGENILADQVVFIPLYQRLDPGAVWSDTIAGFKHNPSQAGDTWNIEQWYRVDLMG